MNPFSWFLIATARNRLSIAIALLVPPAVILGVLAGIQHGPLGVAIGYSAGVSVLALPVIAMCRSATQIPVVDLWNVIRRPLWAGLASASAGIAFKLLLHGTLSPLAALLIGLSIVLAGFAWILLIVFDQRDYYSSIARMGFSRSVTG
jgi:hypothetical protein